MLRNVNLRSRSVCAHTRNQASLKHALHQDVMEDIDRGRSWGGGGGGVGITFLAIEEGEDSTAGPPQRTYLAESSAETSTERS